MIAPRQTTHRLPLDNEQIAQGLEEVADLLEAQDANPFRVRAYRTGAQAVRDLDRPAHEVLRDEGRAGLTRLPGIGEALARAVEELAFTGRLGLLEQLRGEEAPEELLATVPGIGPELAGRIYERLGISTLEELERAAHDGRLAAVPGLGPKRLRAVRDSLAGRLRRRPRPAALRAADEPPVEELLNVDREYREKAAGQRLHLLAPRRFNPRHEAWLPVLHTRRGGRQYSALYSNTALAHRQKATRDWVVIYRDDDGGRQQWTAVTAPSGALRGRRVIRGREGECARYYARQPDRAAAPSQQG
jgi:hypothetical protein